MKTVDFKYYISMLLIAFAMGFVSCSDSDNNVPEAPLEENTIDFTINFVNGSGNAYSAEDNSITQLVNIKYKGETYVVVEGEREAGKIGFNLVTDNTGKKQLVFGGIDGTKEVENEKILIDCANGTTNEITFSNKKVVGRSGEDFVRTYSFNGQPIESPNVICPFVYNSWVASLNMNGDIGTYAIKFKMIDESGNNLLTDEKFRNKVKDGTTITFRGVTSPIVDVDQEIAKILDNTIPRDSLPYGMFISVWGGPEEKANYKLKMGTTKNKDGIKEVIIVFGSLSTFYIYRDQELVINWFDGSKDVIKFTLLYMPKYITDPTSSYYNPEAPLQELNMTCNGEEVTYGTVGSIGTTLQFLIQKTFDWKE